MAMNDVIDYSKERNSIRRNNREVARLGYGHLGTRLISCQSQTDGQGRKARICAIFDSHTSA